VIDYNHEDWLDSLYYLLSILNSLVIEFFVKTFLTGINLNYYILKKIPIPPFNPLDNSVKRLIENTKYLCLNHTDNKLWANKYMENEIIINHLFNLTKTEFEEILNDFDFEKLKKTNFSGHKPFFYIIKKNLIEKF
jgi:hypothetical protein